MKIFISVTEWLKLSPDVKKKLVEQFHIPKTAPVEVMNSTTVVCDGHSAKDLMTLSTGALIEYLGKDLPWYKEDLFENLLTNAIDKLYGKKPKKNSNGNSGSKSTTDGSTESGSKSEETDL